MFSQFTSPVVSPFAISEARRPEAAPRFHRRPNILGLSSTMIPMLSVSSSSQTRESKV